MTCQELVDMLLDFVGGELHVEKHQTVEVHLNGCDRCVVLVETYRHVVRFGKALPKCGALPPAVEARLRKTLEPLLNGEAETKG